MWVSPSRSCNAAWRPRPAAIHESLKRRLARLEARLKEEREGRPGQQPNDPISQPSTEPALDEDDLEEAAGEELEAHEDRLVDRATAAQTIAEFEAEIAELQRLERMAQMLRRSGEDTKWRELDRILDDPLVLDPQGGARRKIVVFTEARDTLEYLAGRIRDRTGEPESVAIIHGSVPRDRRRATIAAFNDDPTVRFLLANDAAGEGVNLQRGAHLMVNYDLPWNPNRLEQRFGRIHRIGQTEVCHLWNLVASETREGAVYQRLLEKLETARATLGGKVFDVLGELFEARPLRELFMEAIRYGEQPEVRAKLFQTIDGAVRYRQHQRARSPQQAHPGRTRSSHRARRTRGHGTGRGTPPPGPTTSVPSSRLHSQKPAERCASGRKDAARLRACRRFCVIETA